MRITGVVSTPDRENSAPFLLSVPEPAELLGLKTWTFRQWLSQRRIAFVKVGRLTKLTQEHITAFIECNRTEAVSHERELVA
jgi:excisionase family DNA binding protein